ncbi:MAG: glutamyl-tRNA reductase [Gammaproteobacteria bacterium]|nr:glutamyl-tRNA reductase [Pseudomonadota bacterium]MCH9662381.1 glutamyl-tRNA reductase [Gammaproteobacteria bacterium]
MSIFCLSFNHRRVPIGLREQFAWSAERQESFLHQLVSETGVGGAMLLSTCNRLEFYSSAGQGSVPEIKDYIVAQLKLIFDQIGEMGQKFNEDDCVRHLIRVACGLDSQSVGETQILGQIKSAWQLAAGAKLLNAELDQLCQFVFRSARHIRRELDLNRHPISIAGTAVQLMRRLYPDIEDKKILLIGAGATSTLVARHLRKLRFSQMRVLNRTEAGARALAADVGAEHAGLDKIADSLVWADIVFSCIDNRPALVGKGMVESAITKRKHSPQLVLDLGVPRNFEAEIGRLDDIFLYDLDQIHQLTLKHTGLRLDKVDAAGRLVEARVEEFGQIARQRSSDPLICLYRQTASEGSDKLIDQAVRKAHSGDVRSAMQWLAARVQGRNAHLTTLLLKRISLDSDALMRELTSPDALQSLKQDIEDNEHSDA